MNSRFTEYEADAPNTTPSRRPTFRNAPAKSKKKICKGYNLINRCKRSLGELKRNKVAVSALSLNKTGIKDKNKTKLKINSGKKQSKHQTM